MPAKQEFRVAVGTPDGLRSTVWKFVVTGSDIYIFTRMFGSDAKVSLHASGECRWSGTDTWVLKEPERRRNADRHIVKWSVARPMGNEAVHMFRVRVPACELRVITPGEDLSAVHWLSAPPMGSTLSLECYLTPPADADPSLSSALPAERLLSFRLSDGRWLIVVVWQCHAAPVEGLENAREQLRAMAENLGLVLNREHRACFFSVSKEGVRGLIEVCPVAGA